MEPSVPSKCQLTFIGLHGATSQKMQLFIATAVRTSNPTYLAVYPERLRKNHKRKKKKRSFRIFSAPASI
jgi:hypothetical protein